MNKEGKHIVSFKTYLIILLLLLTFTFLSVSITQIELGPLAIAGALLFALMKSSLILSYFMHLKFENRVYLLFAGIVILLFVVVIIITFLDYIFK